jgi:hypothetical protein
MFVNPAYVSTGLYEEMCRKAVKIFPPLIEYVRNDFILTPGLYLDLCRTVNKEYHKFIPPEKLRLIKPIWREIGVDPDTNKIPRCGITFEPIFLGENYKMCSVIPHHVYKQDSIEMWNKIKKCGGDAKCVLCTRPLHPSIFING